MPLLRMRGISKRFGATVALNNVDFSVYSGEIHALVGENGAGKSTLMKILSGAHFPDQGEMILAGDHYHPRNPLDARRKGVGMIYQELSLVPNLSVMENIMLGMEPSRFGFIRWKEVQERANRAVSQFNHPEIKSETPVSELTVGAQQLVEIGRALAVGCQVLVLDEPTSSLSQKDIGGLFHIIRSLKQKGIAIIYISHFLEEVQQIADRLTVLRDGFAVGTKPVASVDMDHIVRLMVGREVKNMYPKSDRKRGEKILEIENVSGVQKPRSASLVLHRGEVLGISGLVGAGRTELLRVIFGLDPVRSGTIRIGMYIGPYSPLKRWQQGVGMLSENRKEEGLVLNLSVAENMTLSRLKGFGPLSLILPKHQNNAARHWIDQLDIRCLHPGQNLSHLSGGNQQRVALARLLQHDVDVMLLDEPTKGIDVGAKAKIYQVIDEMATGTTGRRPKAVLMISSYLPELLGICDRIAVMHRGMLSPAKSASELDEHQLMQAATGQRTL